MDEHYQGFGHIGIDTNDISESIAFYEKIGGKLRYHTVRKSSEGKEKHLALMSYAGVELELIQGFDPKPLREGIVTHFAVNVRDVAAAGKALQEIGINTFETAEKKYISDLFGGIDVWTFTGPSGERIQLQRCDEWDNQ